MTAATPHMLVIEDDADTRANLADILDLDGYEVSLAESFEQARQLDVWEDVRIVLLDRKLPDGTAEQLLPGIRERNPETAIIIVTGYRDLEGAIACLREGTEDFILKPINPDELRLAIKRILRNQETQKALRDSEARFRAVIETAVDAIVMIDATGTITDFNPAAEKLFGYRADEAIGRNVRMLMPEPYRQEHGGYIRRYLETGERRIIGIGREVVGRRKEGSTFPMELAVSELKLDDRRLFTGIVRDLTERHRLMNQIVHVAAEEQQRIGHDLHDGLGQELTGISLLAGSLRRRLKEADRAEASDADELVTLVNDAVSHLRGLVKGLCPVKLQDDGVMRALEELASDVENRFQVTCQTDFSRPVYFHDRSAATHVYYIAREAVHNAVRHGRPDRVTIELSAMDGQTARLQVTDDGVGLPHDGARSSGRGMQIMTHRTHMMNGIFRARRADEAGGTIAECIFPLPHREET